MVMIMKLLGNILWLLFGGIIMAFGWVLAGLILCVTIIGIPFGIQCLKIASLVIWPFGKAVEIGGFGIDGLFFNLLWIVVFGWELAIGHLVLALLFSITIVGIPFGCQHVKLAKLGFLPFGAKIN
ncbi:MAG: YccF domain-containing protein [Fibrobacter sp.]|nr:YccF domain-containing protein [Fibrobacter sp.]